MSSNVDRGKGDKEGPQAAPPPLKVDLAAPTDARPDQPWISVVIGKNGAGKSRLLAGIAETFEKLDRRSTGRKGDWPLSQLQYLYGGRRCELEIDDSGARRANIDGRPCQLKDLPLPTKVIALTTTPFDKFRVSPSLLASPRRYIADTSDRYVYLGLRDRTGRASPTAPIFRALDGLFEASRSGGQKRLRVADVFRFLGYKPRVEVQYELAPVDRERLERIVRGDTIESVLVGTGTLYQLPYQRLIEQDSGFRDQIISVGSEVLRRAAGGRVFTLRADFEEHSTADDRFFREVQILRRTSLIRMRATLVERLQTGVTMDLRLASSGELGIVTCFLGLASVIEDGSLIFVDEPEISLHPAWQTSYIDLLLRTFRDFSGCHFVLATHAPLILSDIGKENSNVVSLDPDRGDAENAAEFSGQSVDHLLVTAFEAPGKNNLYLKQEIVRALRLAANGEANSEEYAKIVDGMVDLLPKIREDSSVAQLIRELQTVREATPR